MKQDKGVLTFQDEAKGELHCRLNQPALGLGEGDNSLLSSIA
jgi:hypothetical protein